MFWQTPTALLALWLLPLVAGLLVYAHRKRLAAARRFVDPAMVGRLMPPLRGPRPWIKGGLVLLGLALLIVAAARPRFGVYFEKVVRRGADLIVALDCSRSMTAEDVAPNRLERAKSDIRDLLDRLAGDRVGLVVFAGKPVAKVPLTTDQGFFRAVMDQVDTAAAPRGGTAIGEAIRKCLEALPERTDRDQAIVLITDGEDHDSFPLDAAKQAAERGVRIFTVGLGSSSEGARIPVRDEAGGLRYLKHEGREVWSKVDEKLLEKIALTTGGAYIPAGTRAYDLGQIYEDHLAELAQGEIHAEKRKRYRERFQLFVCLGVACLLAEMAIPGYRLPRRASGGTGAAVSAAAGKAALVLAALAAVGQSARAASPGAAENVRAGIGHYRAGKFDAAVEAFQNAETARPDDPRVQFDLATAHAAAGHADKAEERFRKAALARDANLSARAWYNLGNVAAERARAVFGEKPEEAGPDAREEGMADLAQAVAAYRECLAVDQNHADARHNLEVIRLWIKQMEALWQERDRQKQRQEMGLLEFLAMIEARQRELRTAAKTLSGEPDSPQRRQATGETATAQRELAEEIKPLKDKIRAELQKPGQAPGAAAGTQPAGPSAEQLARAVDLLTGLADDAEDEMRLAAAALDKGTVPEAVANQTTAVEKLDEIAMGVLPFEQLVTKAIGVEEGLVDQSEAAADRADDDTSGEPPDWGESAWNQRFVARWAEILPPKARQGLEALENVDPEALASGGAGQPGAPDPDAIKKQVAGLKESMEKAVELAPKAAKLAGEAADALDARKPTEALPKQKEALELLRQIAEPLPKQDQQNQQDQKQDEKEDEQEKQDEQKQQPKNQEPQQQQQKLQQQKQQQRQQELSRRQAEAVLRKVRERQREHQEKEKQLQLLLAPPGEVDKDW